MEKRDIDGAAPEITGPQSTLSDQELRCSGLAGHIATLPWKCNLWSVSRSRGRERPRPVAASLLESEYLDKSAG
jgi:hypothetical protein